MTTISGLNRLTSPATTAPTTCPASAIALLQPASPSRASSIICFTDSSSSRLAWTRRSSAGPEARVSRQPRLPQRQIGPLRVHDEVSDLAGCAAVTAVGATLDDDAGADARGDRYVGREAGVAPGAEGHLGERAQVGVVVDVGGCPQPVLHLARPRPRPTQPGSTSDGWSAPWSWSIGPARAMPTPSRRSRSRSASSRTLSTSSRGEVEGALGVVVDVVGGRSPRRARCGSGRRRPRAPCRGRSRRRRRRRRMGRARAARPGGRAGPRRRTGRRARRPGRGAGGRPPAWRRWSARDRCDGRAPRGWRCRWCAGSRRCGVG